MFMTKIEYLISKQLEGKVVEKLPESRTKRLRYCKKKKTFDILGDTMIE